MDKDELSMSIEPAYDQVGKRIAVMKPEHDQADALSAAMKADSIDGENELSSLIQLEQDDAKADGLAKAIEPENDVKDELSDDIESGNDMEVQQDVSPEQLCSIADIIHLVLYHTSDILYRMNRLQIVEPMLAEFAPLITVLQPETLLVRAWANELRLFDYEALSTQKYCSWSRFTASKCDFVLLGACEYLRYAGKTMDKMVKKYYKSKNERVEDTVDELLGRVRRVAALYVSLSSVVTQLHWFNRCVSKGRSTPLSTEGLIFDAHEQPFKMMRDVVIEGLVLLNEDGQWKEMLWEFDDWECHMFSGRFPLDAYFDWTPDLHSRDLLTIGLYDIIYPIGMISFALLA